MSRKPEKESVVRTELIDKQLFQAGWSRSGGTLVDEFHMKPAPGAPSANDQFADYVLLGTDGRAVGVVEAKRSSRDVLAGKRQASDYADLLRDQFGLDPFIFLANGNEILFWDRDRYPPRAVSGFFTQDDLERLAHQKKYGIPPKDVAFNPAIAGRTYQIEAIRRVTESVENGRRALLLVMATGTGKTRTAIAIVDLLLRARRIQRVLFLADRRELVRQAMGEFKSHLPQESLARIEGGDVSGTRVQFATYPSMAQVFSRLSPGYYDLIIADESHRSIYQRYKAIFEHFDALQLGLTATPTDYIDHNTFTLFGCEDGLPTFYYSYEQAVAEGNLVNYRVMEAQTRFQVVGIQGDALPQPLQAAVKEEGLLLEELSFEGTDIEKKVTNTGTNNAIAREFMDRCRKDVLGLPHKTIIFAVGHAHATRLYESFNKLFPEHQRRGLAEVIDSQIERADALLDDFKYKDMPRIAISVDMLDTGVDIPAIQNLVFAKPVFSRVKFWQMVGRGTRLYRDPRTQEQKQDFLIIDCWNNFSYFRLNPEGETDHPSEPLPVRLFRLKLEKRALQRGSNENDESTVGTLKAMITSLPLDNINVRPHRDEIEELKAAWPEPTAETQARLSRTIAPLMRYAWAWSLPDLQFRVLCERIATARLRGETGIVETLRDDVRESLSRLPDNIHEIARVAEPRAHAMTPEFWEHLSTPRIDELQDRFAPLMRFRIAHESDQVELHLPDQIASRHWVAYGPTGEGAFADTYRAQVEASVRKLADSLPALAKLKRGDRLEEEDLVQIASALNQPDWFITEDTLKATYQQPTASLLDVLRHILGLAKLPTQEEWINAAFDQFIREHQFLRSSQLNYLRAVRAAVLRRADLNRNLLSQPPLSRIADVEQIFKPHEIDEILAFANRLVKEMSVN